MSPAPLSLAEARRASTVDGWVNWSGVPPLEPQGPSCTLEHPSIGIGPGPGPGSVRNGTAVDEIVAMARRLAPVPSLDMGIWPSSVPSLPLEPSLDMRRPEVVERKTVADEADLGDVASLGIDTIRRAAMGAVRRTRRIGITRLPRRGSPAPRSRAWWSVRVASRGVADPRAASDRVSRLLPLDWAVRPSPACTKIRRPRSTRAGKHPDLDPDHGPEPGQWARRRAAGGMAVTATTS